MQIENRNQQNKKRRQFCQNGNIPQRHPGRNRAEQEAHGEPPENPPHDQIGSVFFGIMITQLLHDTLDKDKTDDTAKEHDFPASHGSAEHLGKNVHDAEHESGKDSVDDSDIEQNYHLDYLKPACEHAGL